MESSNLQPIETRANEEKPEIPTFILWFTLFLITLISTNNYFSYHTPSAIAGEFLVSYQLDSQQFGTLFTIYSAPNIVLVFLSGIFVDKYGLKLSSILFNSCILAGMIVCAVTPFPSSTFPSTASYGMLLLGRFLLGVGGESIVSACSETMIAKWFANTEYLNTAMSVNQASVQLLGSSASFFLLPRLHSVEISQWVAVLVCVVSLFATLAYIKIETDFGDSLLKINGAAEQSTSLIQDEPAKNSYHHQSEKVLATNESSSANIGAHIWEIITSFSLLFWILLAHIGFMTPILYTFTAFGQLYFEENFESTRSAEIAGNSIAVLYLAMFFSPITGRIIDYVQHRSLVQFIATLNIPLIFTLLAFEIFEPFWCMLWMGFIFSITESNALALVCLIEPSEKHGSAFGLIGCAVSIALLVEPAVVGELRRATGSFTVSIWLFVFVSVLGSLTALLMYIYDLRHNNLISKGECFKGCWNQKEQKKLLPKSPDVQF